MFTRHPVDVAFCFIVQVAFYETMFLHRPGVLPRQKLLRANKSFRGKERRNHVLVEATGAPGEQCIDVLILFVMCVFEGKKKKCAFEKVDPRSLVRWPQPQDAGWSSRRL